LTLNTLAGTVTSQSLKPSGHSGFWKRERTSEGREYFEGGTLNVDRKANRKGAALFNGLPLWRELQKPGLSLEVVTQTLEGRITEGTEDECYRSAHARAMGGRVHSDAASSADFSSVGDR
jgi:hypothetical protein